MVRQARPTTAEGLLRLLILVDDLQWVDELSGQAREPGRYRQGSHLGHAWPAWRMSGTIAGSRTEATACTRRRRRGAGEDRVLATTPDSDVADVHWPAVLRIEAREDLVVARGVSTLLAPW